MSNTKWKGIVSDKVEEVVFDELLQQSKGLSKIREVEYESFGCQEYISTMDTFSVRKIARLRSRTFACKANQKSANSCNLLCRAGCEVEESQDHLINCWNIHGEVSEMDVSFVRKRNLDSNKRNLHELLRRMDVVENWCMD